MVGVFYAPHILPTLGERSGTEYGNTRPNNQWKRVFLGGIGGASLKPVVKGNLAGIKNSVLHALQGLYEFTVAKNLLISPELVWELAVLTSQVNREIAVYLNRRGQVIEVAVGDHATVSLPDVKGRKDPNRLSGVRCVHTHPESSPELSVLDLTSLSSMKLDCMAALEVRDGQPGRINAAYLQPEDRILGRQAVMVEILPAELLEHPFQSIIALIDKQTAGGVYTSVPCEERAVLVALDTGSNGWTAAESLAELAELARTAGARVLSSVSQKRSKPDPATFIGRGKARELGMLAQELDANCLIFDDELSPAQTRNLELLAGCKILDRTAVILDIFASRAHTREGKVQVELAQLKHLLPRLSGLGSVLSRLGGGIGTRGPGETKLETDRRHIRRRIAELEKDLEAIKTHRTLQRTRRKDVPVPIVALVGYTNAGKSSLLNALTNSQVLAEDKLFATLDPITRHLRAPGQRDILLTDTVGFVRKLPHHLVAAFRATLEEVVQADLLVHVVDASHPGLAEQVRAVEEVLHELRADDKPTLVAFNKIDKPELASDLASLRSGFPHSVLVSALTGQGLDELARLIGTLLPALGEILVLIPFERGDLLAAVHNEGEIRNLEYLAEGAKVKVLAGPRLAALIRPFALDALEQETK